jgi:hypothetical protein
MTWLFLASLGFADPTTPGFTITTYAPVTDPEGLAFAPDGTLYVGRDDSGSNGSGAAAVKIHQVSPGGTATVEYGDDAIPDPDAVAFDANDAISGIPGAVIVGGSTDSSFSQGQLVAIAPNGAVSSVVSVGTNPRNPNQLIFDHTGRLLIADFGAVGVSDGKVLALSPGGTPTTLITPPADPFFIAVDENNQIFVNTEDGNIRVYDATGVQVNGAFATGLGSAPMAFGPGGAFGHELYTVTDAGNLLRIDQQGNQTVLGSGFGVIENLAFGPDGALYLAEFSNDRILRLAAPPCIAPPNGLVGWWPGDGNTNDLAAGNNGVLHNGAAFATGKVGQGFSFDGVNDFVSAPHNTNLDITGDLTIDAWINPALITGDQRVIATKRSLDDNDVTYAFFLKSTGVLSFTSRSGGGGFIDADSIATIPLNQLTHVAVTIQGTTLTFYINGAVSRTLAYTVTRPSTTGAVTIGIVDINVLPGLSHPFKGVVDEVEIFNRALPAGEISQIFAAGSAGKCKTDHFFCYKTKATKNSSEVFTPPSPITLTTIAEAGVRFDIKKPLSLCLPAKKNGEGVADEDTHLVAYQISLTKMTPPQSPPQRFTNLVVHNQFGDITLDTVKPTRLLVPTAKDLAVSPLPPGPNDVDHYRCDAVKLSQSAPLFTPILNVQLADQFIPAGKQFKLTKPLRLCAPVAKNGEPIKNAASSLLCYRALRMPGEPAHATQLGVHLHNQFGVEQVDTVKEEELCVPSSLIGQGSIAGVLNEQEMEEDLDE